VVRDVERLLGFGAIAVRDPDEAGVNWGEVKRMYVAPAARGRRIGRLIMDQILAHAQEQQVAVLRLETGDKQPEALGLYRSAGFEDCGPFGGYEENGSSVFMELRLARSGLMD
jgi:putative acetyltransferase